MEGLENEGLLLCSISRPLGVPGHNFKAITSVVHFSSDTFSTFFRCGVGEGLDLMELGL